MPEQTFKKAGDLNPATYTDELIIVVSNPAIPEGPSKESESLLSGEIRPQRFDWNPLTQSDISTLMTVKNGDFLTVIGLTNPILFDGQRLLNGDTLHILNKQTGEFKLIPDKTKRNMRLVVAPYNVTIPMYDVLANDEVLVDVTDGEVHCRLPTIHEDGDEVLFIPLAGNYAINPLVIHSTENLAGTVDDPVRVNVDNLLVRCVWVQSLNRWILTAN